MTILVEDGTGLALANAYASEDEADAYFDDRANDQWASATGDKEAALIRASQAIDMKYWSRFPGTKLRPARGDQGMEWPRINASDIEGYEIASDAVPIEIKQATIEAALREVITPGSMNPDIKREVRSVAAGTVNVAFASNAKPTTQFNIIDSILGRLIGTGGSSRYTGTAARG